MNFHHGVQMRQKAEAEALLQAAIQALPEPFRADGPRLAFEFDDPPGPKKARKTPAGSRPTSAKAAPKRKRPISPAAPASNVPSQAGEPHQESMGDPHEPPASEAGQDLGRSEMEEDWGAEAEGEGKGEVQVCHAFLVHSLSIEPFHVISWSSHSKTCFMHAPGMTSCCCNLYAQYNLCIIPIINKLSTLQFGHGLCHSSCLLTADTARHALSAARNRYGILLLQHFMHESWYI